MILVAVDFLPASLKAMEHAVTLAKQLDASIVLLHVVEPMYTGGFLNQVTRRKVRREARRRALEKIQALANAQNDQNVPVACVVQNGLPEYEILQFAESRNVDMIVLGRRLRNFLGRWFLGSVSDDIIDIAPCPVVVVNGRVSVSLR